MCAIVAVDENWAIGNKGELLVSLPEDQKQNFKVKTLGHPVVYGRKTLETFPKKMLLPGRENIILSRNKDFAVDGATILHSVDEVLDYTKKREEEVFFIIGGAQIYDQFLPYCDTCIVTKVKKTFEADAFFPNLDNIKEWKLYSREAIIHSVKGVSFEIWTYRRCAEN
ncbi:MAG: dihydrofolate reductase [Clostridiales bacterium]|nr:dihydrofolate reductase [Clostridiales bacterium]